MATKIDLHLLVTNLNEVEGLVTASFKFTNAGGSIGSDESCDWVLKATKDLQVGSHHARIVYHNGFYCILQQDKAVYLNRAQTPIGTKKFVMLTEGSLLRIGQLQIRVAFAESSESIVHFAGRRSLEEIINDTVDQSSVINHFIAEIDEGGSEIGCDFVPEKEDVSEFLLTSETLGMGQQLAKETRDPLFWLDPQTNEEENAAKKLGGDLNPESKESNKDDLMHILDNKKSTPDHHPVSFFEKPQTPVELHTVEKELISSENDIQDVFTSRIDS